MQLQGIVFIQLQGNDILVNCQGNTDSFKEHIFIHKKYNHSRQLNSDTKIYSFQFVQGNISSFNENIFIQGNYIHSRKYAHFRNIYSFKFKAICSFKEIYLLNIVTFAEQQKYLFKNCPQPLYDNCKLYNYYLLNKV